MRHPRRRWIPAVALGLPLFLLLGLCGVLSFCDIHGIKPLLTRLVKEKTGRELLIRGPIRIKAGASPSLVVEDVALGNAPWGGPDEMIRVEQLKLQIRLLPLLRKRIEVRSLTLVEPTLFIETDPSGKSNFSFDTPKKMHGPSKTKSECFGLGHILVEKGRLSFKEGTTGQVFSGTVDRLEARRPAGSVLMELEAEGCYESKHFMLQGRVGTLETLLDSEEPWLMDAAARAFGVEVRMEGFLPKPLSLEGLILRFRGTGRSTLNIAGLFGRNGLPEWGPFVVEGQLSGKKDRGIHISGLKLSAKGLDGGGELELNFGAQIPGIKGSLDFRQLDFPQFFQTAGVPKRGQALEKEKKVFSLEPIPLLRRRFGRVSVDLGIKAEKVLLPSMVLSRVNERIRVSEDRLLAESLEFKVGGGEVQGFLEIDLRGKTPILLARAGMQQVDVHTFLKEKSISGKASAGINLAAQGSSVAALLGGLEGNAFFSFNTLSFSNKLFKSNGSRFEPILLQIFAPASTDPNTTEINCLVGGFDIREGLAEVTTLLADTHEVVVLGKGHLDLEKETLNLSLRPYPKKGVAGVSVSLTELTKAFKLGGTLADPSLQMDPLRSAWSVGKMLGGIILLGPAGAAVVFAGQTADEGDLCLAAVEAAREAVRESEAGPGTYRERPEAQRKNVAGEAKDSEGGRLGKFWKKLSSQPGAPVDVYGGGP